jgi:dUTP pyrophosphatase
MAKKKSKKLKTVRIKVRVKILPHGEGLPLPEMQSAGAAGLDLVAAIDPKKPLRLARGKFALIPTGLSIELPHGTEAQVRPRSGLAAKHGVTILNSPGTIDSDYRGEIQVILINLGDKPFVINRGDRIAQMIVATHARVKMKPIAALSKTARGAGGFGSTGKASASAAKPAKKPNAPIKKKADPSPAPATRRMPTAKRK